MTRAYGHRHHSQFIVLFGYTTAQARSAQSATSALVGVGGGAPGLLQLLLGLLLLLLLPRTGSKLLFQGIHLALKQVPLPLRHPPRLHGPQVGKVAT